METLLTFLKLVLPPVLTIVAMLTLWLDYYNKDGRTNDYRGKRKYLFGSVALVGVVSTCVALMDEMIRRKEKELAEAQIRQFEDAQTNHYKLSKEVMAASGLHDIFPRFFFFFGSEMKIGQTKALQSTFLLTIMNPSNYPIYDLDVTINEQLEREKWTWDGLAKARAGVAGVTDGSGHVKLPEFVSTNLHFQILQPHSPVQVEILAPPAAGKTNYAYLVATSARNGQARYRHHYILRGAGATLPRFEDFFKAWQVLRVVHETNTNGTWTHTHNKIVDEYHDPDFPLNADGKIDYGPPLLGYTE